MIKSKTHILIFLFLFSVFFFQVTTYKYIFDLAYLSAIVNLFLSIFLIVYFLTFFIFQKINKKVFLYYLVPGLLILGGMSFNFILNIYHNPNIYSQFGLVLPWIFFVTMPYIFKDRLNIGASVWAWYYYLIICILTIAIVEFYAVTAGLLLTRQIEMPNGSFQAGLFSIYHLVGNGVDKGAIHERLYGPFGEPMFLASVSLPALIFGVFHGRYFGCFIILFAVILTKSLTGFVSIYISLVFTLFLMLRERYLKFFIPIIFCLMLIFIYNIEYTYGQYLSKGESASIRFDNFTEFFTSFLVIFFEWPFGFINDTGDKLAQVTLPIGTNFSVGNAFIFGGIFSLVGYLLILILLGWYCINVLKDKYACTDKKVVAVSIISIVPFVYAGSPILDYSMFALLFSSFLVKDLA